MKGRNINQDQKSGAKSAFFKKELSPKNVRVRYGLEKQVT